MKGSTIRLVIILAAIAIVGIITVQVYWVQRAFDFKEKQFNQTVHIALKNVGDRMLEFDNTQPGISDPVTQLSSNYYVVMVNHQLDANLLEYFLKDEFKKRNLLTDFEYGIYDCQSDAMVYGNYISFDSDTAKTTASRVLPKWQNADYYFGVYFPSRDQTLANQMAIWAFSSFVLLIVIVFFSYALFVILKQKRLSEVRNDFINNMAHEFKTPISTIVISSDVLKNPSIVEKPERLLKYAGVIQDEAKRLKNQVERVLQMATIDKEEIKLNKESVSVHELVKKVLKHIDISLQERNGQIECSFEAINDLVEADSLHLTNILYNLLDNAVKYSEDAPQISVHTSNERQGLQVSITDHGVGMSKDEQKMIFEKFYRVPTGNLHDVKGFGLGLHYVQTMVKAHRGQLQVKSQKGKGSSFTVWLPQVKV